ncbi:MAG: hypothetical protein M3Z20_02750 [Chloroflexota bacterium]|nr:hypothetical protein [Chloroflexota bacterium]
MDESRFAGLTRMMSGLTSRRLAVATAAVSGLALAGQADAKDDVKSEGKKRYRRGKRGKQGAQGPQGPAGPVSGSDAVLVKKTCTLGADNNGELEAVEGCTATCDNGFVAVGGGYEGPTVFEALGRVISSFPTQSGQNPPNGWETRVGYIAIGDFDVKTYVICLPE